MGSGVDSGLKTEPNIYPAQFEARGGVLANRNLHALAFMFPVGFAGVLVVVSVRSLLGKVTVTVSCRQVGKRTWRASGKTKGQLRTGHTWLI